MHTLLDLLKTYTWASTTLNMFDFLVWGGRGASLLVKCLEGHYLWTPFDGPQKQTVCQGAITDFLDCLGIFNDSYAYRTCTIITCSCLETTIES